MRTRHSLAFLAALTLVACGGGGEERTAPRQRSGGAAPAAGAPAASGYTVAAVAGGGSVSGKVAFAGEAPAPETLEITKDTSVCGTEKQFQAVEVSDGGLANAVVWIDGIASGKDWGSINGATIDQQKCVYTPSIQVMKAGDTLNIVNSDPILHNIHAYHNDKETIFNLAQPMQGMTTPKTMDKTGPVHMKCDVHSWMSGWIFVAGHPYYTVTGADGSFNLGDVPAGSYTVKAWHPKYGEKTASVTVASGAAADPSFSMP